MPLNTPLPLNDNLSITLKRCPDDFAPGNAVVVPYRNNETSIVTHQ